MAFLSNAGLERLWAKITDKLSTKVDKVDGKGLSTNDYTTAEKNKLSGIDTGANKTTVDSVLSTTSTNPVQNKVVNTAISNLNTLVGDKSVSSQISSAIASKADTSHTHSAATTSAAGFMSTADKTKLDGVETGANKTTVDDALSSTSINPVQNKVINSALAGKAASDHIHSKSDVGLGNVDNTADANKSVKYATSAGSAASVTGTVDFAHGGTGRTNRDSAYSALMSGGTYTGNLNDCKNAGVYLFTTSNTTNYPDYIGRDTNWAILEVTTTLRDSTEVHQRVTWSTSEVQFNRLCASGTTWGDWQPVVSGSVAHRQFVKYIPSGADLNDDLYKINGVYVSYSSDNVISNLPPYFGNGKGAFTLIVTGINPVGTYTNQILISLDGLKMYVRSQQAWKEPYAWTDWNQVLIEDRNSSSSVVKINSAQRNVEPNLYFERNVGGYKYTRMYEANSSDAEIAIGQKSVNGSETITRLNWNGDHVTLTQDSNKLWLGSAGSPIARFYTADYGSTLPTDTHTKGRVFFLKA